MTRHLTFAFMAILLMAAGVVRAADLPTPAGTIIRNHAVLTYQSLAGVDQVSSSNEVVMQVQPVYGISITPDGSAATPGQTLTAVANRTLVFPYLMTFTGNTRDSATLIPVFDAGTSTFRPKLPSGQTGFSVYSDLNANGQIDAGDVLAASWSDTDDDGVVDSGEIGSVGLGASFDPNETAYLLISFNTPATAAIGQVTHFGVNGVSTGDVSVSDLQGNISRGVIVDDAVMTIVKAADKSEAAPGDTITFTLNAENTGTAAAKRRGPYSVNAGPYNGVLIYDPIPKTVANVPLPISGVPVGVNSAGAAGTIIYSTQADTTTDPTTWTWTTASASATVVGYILSTGGGTDADLPAAATMGLTFVVSVPTGTVSQTIQNQAYADYDNQANARQNTPSNIVKIILTGVPGVIIRDTDFELPKPSLTPANDSVADRQTIATAQAGKSIYFTNRVLNQRTDGVGTVTDSYNITTAGLPAGWALQLLRSDGVTPLGDTGVDGLPDTGPIAPGGYVDIVVRVFIPDGTVLATATDITLTATSIANNGVTDTTVDRISAVTGPAVTLYNNRPIGTPDLTSVAATSAAGRIVYFPLMVLNPVALGGKPDTYTLAATVGGDNVADWTVTYYRDANENGILDPVEALAIGNTLPVNPQDYEWLIARVSVPSNAATDAFLGSGTSQDPYTVTFVARSTNDATLTSTIIDTVVLDYRNGFTLLPDRRSIAEAGGVVTYSHTLTNFGDRPNRFYLDLAPGTATWAFMLTDDQPIPAELPRETAVGVNNGKYYIDLTKAGTAGDTSILNLRVFVPINVPVGTTDVSSITAFARDFGITETDTVVDVTQIVSGELALTKSYVTDPAGGSVRPGDDIIYTTEYFNKSNVPLRNVIIIDTIPRHTDYVLSTLSATAPSGIGITFQISKDGGVTWLPAPAGATPDPTITSLRAVLDSPLPAGAKGTVTFRVRVE